MAESVPNSVSSLEMATLSTLMPRFFWKSARKSNIACVKCSSWGELRKNHLNPRRVSPGELDSALKCGMPKRSATWLVVAVTLECQAPTRTCAFSWVISRSASAWPMSGLP